MVSACHKIHSTFFSFGCAFEYLCAVYVRFIPLRLFLYATRKKAPRWACWNLCDLVDVCEGKFVNNVCSFSTEKSKVPENILLDCAFVGANTQKFFNISTEIPRKLSLYFAKCTVLYRNVSDSLRTEKLCECRTKWMYCISCRTSQQVFNEHCSYTDTNIPIENQFCIAIFISARSPTRSSIDCVGAFRLKLKLPHCQFWIWERRCSMQSSCVYMHHASETM